MKKNHSICIVNCGSNKIDGFYTLLEELGNAYQTVPLIEANNYFFQDSCGVIISGGPHLFTDEAQKNKLIS